MWNMLELTLYGFTASEALGVNTLLNQRLKSVSPSVTILGTAFTAIALTEFLRWYNDDWGKSTREQIADLALKVPFIQEKYNEKIQAEFLKAKKSTLEKWAAFGELITEIPEEGMSLQDLKALVDRYSRITTEGVANKHLSGTIYSRSLVDASETSNVNLENVPDDLSEKIKAICTYAFEKASTWNSLHANEFSVGALIDYQVVRMVAKMFGGEKNEVMGFVTSGGTESLMTAIRAYRNWGMTKKGLGPTECVIVAPKTVHAAILKAKQAYFPTIALVETDASGKVDLKDLEGTLKKYGNRVVAVIGSAPSYPTGVVDPIEEMAALALKYDCGMHVDCCLGGFVINHLPQHRTAFLKMPGVTSLSADPHKNGYTPKGISTLIAKDIGKVNLTLYSIFPVPKSMCGVYGSPKNEGSQAVDKSLMAQLTMCAVGSDEYDRIANQIHGQAKALASDVIGAFEGSLMLVADPDVNVVAFKIDPAAGLEEGAIYALAHVMEKHNIVLNAISNEMVHFCITLRFASDEQGLTKFKQAITDSLEEVRALDIRVKAGEIKFPGDAGMYCALDAAFNPTLSTSSWMSYTENVLLGPEGANDAIRAYFLAKLDPFKESWITPTV